MWQNLEELWCENEALWRSAKYLLTLEQLLKIFFFFFLVTCYCSLASL